MEARNSRSWDPAPAAGGDELFGEEVAAALRAVAGERDPLRRAARLRALLPPRLAARAAQLAELRERIEKAYPRLPPLFATREGLEMASREEAAAHRARRIAGLLPGCTVLDATCGIGVDALALAAAGVPFVAADRSALHARCAARNLAHQGFPPRVVVADALAPAARAEVLLLDPERRPGGRRTLDPARWSPPLARALELAARHRGACLKLAPALDIERVAPPAPPARWSWVSVRRELCELVLWLGDLAGPEPGEVAGGAPGGPPAREVVALGPAGEARFEAVPEAVEPWGAAELAELPFLAEPDPALIRSGLLGALARREGLRPLAARLAYLGGEREPASPFLTAWRVLGSAPLDRKRVRELLERHGVGPLEVRKRGHDEPAEVLARRFAGRGPRRGVLIVARTDAGRRAFLVEAPKGPTGSTGSADAARRRDPEPPPDSSAGGVVGDEGFEPPASSV